MAKCTSGKQKPKEIWQCQIHQRHSVPLRRRHVRTTDKGIPATVYVSMANPTRHHVCRKSVPSGVATIQLQA